MSDVSLIYYNMLADFVKGNRIVQENVAVKKMWQNEDLIFCDLYFYKTKESKVYDSMAIHGMTDLNTGKVYSCPQEMFDEYVKRLGEKVPEADALQDKKNANVLDNLGPDFHIILFIANLGEGLTEYKINNISKYIVERYPECKSLSNQYIRKYLVSAKPTEKNFYDALNIIKTKHKARISDMLQNIIKLTMSDGVFKYTEKVYIAEIYYVLREYGITF